MFIKYLKSIYQAENDGDGGDGGGSGVVDRGDAGAVVDDVVAAEERGDVAPARDAAGKFVAADDAAADGAAAADDEAAVAAAAAAKEAKDKGKMIPKARFDEAVAKERGRAEAAERRAAELLQQIKQVSHAEDAGKLDEEIRTLSAEAEAARMDGDKDKVIALSEQIRMKERQLSLAENSRMSESTKEAVREEMRMDMTIERLEGLYPVLNEADAEHFDQDIVDLVLATQRDLIAREQLKPSVALERATEKVMLKVMKPSSDGVTPEKGGLKDAEGKKDDRKQAQVKKNLDTAIKQPASTKESGVDSDAHGQSKADPDPSLMTYEEFGALPEATKAKMRGDFA